MACLRNALTARSRVLQELIDNDEANFADAGGFVSPGGISYIGESGNFFGCTPLAESPSAAPWHVRICGACIVRQWFGIQWAS